MMEPWMVVVLVAVAGVGVAIGYGLGQRQSDAREKQKKAEQALRDYKTQVAAHFGKTAELFDKLTNDYREVYEHLAQSSENLCGDQVPRITADVPSGRLLAEDQVVGLDEVRVKAPMVSEPDNMEEKAPVAEPDYPGSGASGNGKAANAASDSYRSGSGLTAEAPSRKPESGADSKTGQHDPSPMVAPPAAEAVDPDIMADDDNSRDAKKPSRT